MVFGLVLTHGMHSVRAEDEDAPAADDVDDEDYAEAERAQLIVRKSLSEDLGVQGRNLTFTIELYNAGTSSAKDVNVVDAPLPEELKLIEGSLETTFPTIEPGASIKHTYTALAVKGEKGVYLESATVTYVSDMDGTKQVTRSSQPGIYIMTPMEQIMRWALIAGRWVTLGMARTPTDWRNLAIVLLVVGGAIGGNSVYKQGSKARTDRQRKKALESLEKDE